MTLVTMSVIDKIGRCYLLIISATIMCLSSAGLAVCFVLSVKLIIIISNVISPNFVLICISAYSLSFGTCTLGDFRRNMRISVMSFAFFVLNNIITRIFSVPYFRVFGPLDTIPSITKI